MVGAVANVADVAGMADVADVADPVPVGAPAAEPGPNEARLPLPPDSTQLAT